MSAWSAYGLNIDGKTTSAQSTDVCTQAEGASRRWQADGQNGIDNSFGLNLLPILITTAGSNFNGSANDHITQGGPTMLIQLDSLGAGPTYNPLPGAMVRAAASSVPPRWDGSDLRNVNSASLTGDGGAPSLSFPNGYLAQQTWVGAPPSGPGLVDLSLISPELVLPVLMTHLQIAMTLGPTRGTASGVLSSVLPIDGVLAWLHVFVGAISTSLCSGSAFASIAAEFEQASDIMIDGTNEPAAFCDGISIGLGFDAVAVQMGPAVAVPAAADPCADAGQD